MNGSQRLYFEPPPSEIDKYEQRGDGCWYPKTDVIGPGEFRYVEAHPTDEAVKVGDPKWQIGDINSNERGSAARFNAGKVPMQYIPFEQQLKVLDHYLTRQNDYIFKLLFGLSLFEKHELDIDPIVSHLEVTDLHAAAFAWEYGASQYTPWNWAKGMPWSVPLACISRHAQAIVVEQEELDPESGCEHWGHIVCNLLMLDHYSRYFKEGDDRPPKEVFRG